MADNYWAQLHDLYSDSDWVTKPSLFAETAAAYLPKTGSLLELGAGLGQDSAYFSQLGYRVTATDLNVDRLEKLADGIFTVRPVDLRQPLPFAAATFDIVYAHLSLHYFGQHTTERIFADIYRVLEPGGVIAFFTNSIDDPEFATGRQIEPNYFDIEGVSKRYFDVAAARQFAHAFTTLLADNNGETYKDSAKGVHHMIRYVGTKP
jgi:SAM-dependent methyltransferase